MIKKTVTVLLIEDSPEYAELIRAWLGDEEDAEFVLNWTDSLQEGMNTLAQGGINVVLLDLGLPDSRGPETFIATRNAAQGVPIIVLSGGDSEALALRMVQEGAQDYLVKSACSSVVLKKAVQYAIVRNGTQVEKAGSSGLAGRAKVIGMFGAKGGVGTTTIACNLAVDVRRQTQHKTLLADLDMDAGLVNFFMKSEARYSVMNSASHSHHTDTSCWEGIVAQSGSGLHIARSPGRMGATKVSDLDRVRHLITLWSGSYQWILLDLGRLNAFSLGLLDRVDELLLVSTTNAPALHEAKRLITTLQEAGFREDRLRLVVNQFGNRNGYEESDLDGLFGIPVYAKLPCAAQELHRAGANPNQLGEDNEFRGHIARLARKVAGLPNKQSKSKVSQMFSFADRFRKSDRQDSPARTA